MTSIDFLKDWMSKNQYFIGNDLLEAFEKTKEMHKQEIIDAHIEGQRVFDKYDHTQWTTDQAEQYYQETFKKD